tara:strand:+ start:1642 stop:2133 length:492 start_codon:yes stop_codon:yes gene_type:complete
MNTENTTTQTKPCTFHHKDHGLTDEHTNWITDTFIPSQPDGFFLEVVRLPHNLPDLTTALYGPSEGDPPVHEDDVKYVTRGERPGPSRILVGTAFKPRACRNICIIGIKAKEYKTDTVFTAYGTGSNEPTPREWWDTSLVPKEAIKAAKFWSNHALAQTNEED